MGAELPAEADAGLQLQGAAPLQEAGPGELSYLDSRRFLPALRATRAAAVLLRAEHAAEVPAGTVALVVADPHLAFARCGRPASATAPAARHPPHGGGGPRCRDRRGV